MAALERDDAWAARQRPTLARDSRWCSPRPWSRAGLRARCEAPLRAGGRAELLVTADAPGAYGGGGAGGARGDRRVTRARVRRLAGHGGVDAVVVASPRARHRDPGRRGGWRPSPLALLPAPG